MLKNVPKQKARKKSLRATTKIDDILGKYISSVENTSRKTTVESYSS